MRFIRGSGQHPSFQEIFLTGLQFLAGMRGRHDLVRIIGKDPAQQFTVGWPVRVDRLGGNGVVTPIDPQIRFPGSAVRSVTGKAVFSENRPNITIVGRFFRPVCRRQAGHRQRANHHGKTKEARSQSPHAIRPLPWNREPMSQL
jgi:hypothetical protein